MKNLKEKIIDVLEDFDLGYTSNSGRKGMKHWADKIKEIVKKEIMGENRKFNIREGWRRYKGNKTRVDYQRWKVKNLLKLKK